MRYRRSETQLSHGGGAGEIALETVRVLERMCRDDPALYIRHRTLFQHRLAMQFIGAAGAIGQSDRVRALKLLILGVRRKLIVGAALDACARIFVPRFAIKVLKRAWRGLVSVFN